MALPVNGRRHLIPAYYSFYRLRKDERLSWPSLLTYSGWLTHISGHPSAAGRAQDKESSPETDVLPLCYANQPGSRYQKGKTNSDFTDARDSEWQWHQLHGPYANLHLAPDRQPHQHPTTLFFTGRMPFLPPNHQRENTEGQKTIYTEHQIHSRYARLVVTHRPICVAYKINCNNL